MSKFLLLLLLLFLGYKKETNDAKEQIRERYIRTGHVLFNSILIKIAQDI